MTRFAAASEGPNYSHQAGLLQRNRAQRIRVLRSIERSRAYGFGVNYEYNSVLHVCFYPHLADPGYETLTFDLLTSLMQASGGVSRIRI